MNTTYTEEYIVQKMREINTEINNDLKRLKFWKRKLKRVQKEVKDGKSPAN